MSKRFYLSQLGYSDNVIECGKILDTAITYNRSKKPYKETISAFTITLVAVLSYITALKRLSDFKKALDN